MNVLPIVGPNGERFDPFNEDNVYSGIKLYARKAYSFLIFLLTMVPVH